jgi:hypothetical protein
MATGENSGTWGNVTNANLGDAIEQAIVETATVTFASNNVTLTLSDSNSRQDARALRLNLTGTTGGARDLIVPAIQKPYLVNNGTADTITVKVSGQTGIAVPASTSMLLYNNGTDVGLAFNRVVGDLIGTASNATVLQTARTIAISGNVTGTATSFDGSANISIDATAVNADGITSGTLAVARGGTGATTLNSEAVIIGNTTGAVKFVAPGTDGNVLTSNGTAWVSEAISAGGDYVMQVYTSPATWTKPASIKAVKVTVLGGGGGGGNTNPGTPAGSSGGGGGGVAIEYLDAPAIPGPVSVTAGAGGGGGSGGQTSSFGAFLSATGGAAGPAGTPASGGAGGSGSGGQLNWPGGKGGNNIGFDNGAGGGGGGGGDGTEAGNPASNLTGGGAFGRAGEARNGQGNGNPAPGYGNGGGGSARPGGGPSYTGGSGSTGFVIVEEFY